MSKKESFRTGSFWLRSTDLPQEIEHIPAALFMM